MLQEKRGLLWVDLDAEKIEDAPIVALDHVWLTLSRDERLLRSGPAYLLYLLVDELVAHYMTTAERVEDSLETIETEVLLRPGPTRQERILALKHIVLQLRRVTALQREVLNKLARDPFAVIDAEARFYFREVYEHMVRLYELIDGVRDLVMGALDLYLEAINNCMNEVMKTLTIITTLFMHLSFITGFFGKN